MKQEQWLANYIDLAFADVILGDGVDIYTAQSHYEYGNRNEELLSCTAERLDWRKIPVGDLLARLSAISFLDAEGFRYYLPAIMTAILVMDDPDSCGFESFYNSLSVTPAGIIKGVHFHTLFTSRQRAALIRFLKYIVYNYGGTGDCYALRLLKRIQTRTSP